MEKGGRFLPSRLRPKLRHCLVRYWICILARAHRVSNGRRGELLLLKINYFMRPCPNKSAKLIFIDMFVNFTWARNTFIHCTYLKAAVKIGCVPSWHCLAVFETITLYTLYSTVIPCSVTSSPIAARCYQSTSAVGTKVIVNDAKTTKNYLNRPWPDT
jgi:hypothetical protein